MLKAVAKRHTGNAKNAVKLKGIFDSQGGRCAYSGRPIRIGGDAELDHIVPESKGGTGELSNLQWVCKAANEMKRSMLESEFFALIRDIVRTKGIA